MKQFKILVTLASLAFTLTYFGSNALAQPAPGGGYGGGAGGYGGGAGGGFGGGGGGGGGFGGGNFNISALLQTGVDNMRPDLAVTNDDEWNAISPLILKVLTLQLSQSAGLGNVFGRGGRGGGGGGRGRGGIAALLGNAPDPAADALDAAVNDNAPVATLKAAMAAVRESRRKKQAEFAKAQADLKAVVTVRQEAYLVNAGILE
jgi:hypothetical protein